MGRQPNSDLYAFVKSAVTVLFNHTYEILFFSISREFKSQDLLKSLKLQGRIIYLELSECKCCKVSITDAKGARKHLFSLYGSAHAAVLKQNNAP